MSLSLDVQKTLRIHRQGLERRVGKLRVLLELMDKIVILSNESPDKFTDRGALVAWMDTRARLAGSAAGVSAFATTDLELSG